MATVDRYRERLGAQSGGPSLVSVPQGGNPVGGSLRRLGGTILDANETVARRQAQEQDERYQREVEREARFALTDSVKTEADWDAHVDSIDFSQEGAVDELQKQLAETRTKSLAAYKTPEARDRWDYLWTQIETRATTKALGRRAQVVAKKSADDASEALSSASRIVDRDPTRYTGQLATAMTLIDELPGLTADQKRDFTRDTRDTLATAAVTGMIRTNPRQALKALAAKGDENGRVGVPAIDALDFDKRAALTSRAQSEVNRLEAEARARQAEAQGILRADLEDAFAQRQMGLPATMPDRKRFVAAYGAEGAARYTEVATRWKAHDVAAELAFLPPAEAAQRIEALKAGATQEGASDRLAAVQIATQVYGEQRRRLEADPAAALTQRDPGLAALLDRGRQGDPAALKQYVDRQRAMQATLGVEKPRVLPESMAVAVSEALAANPDQPGARAQKLQQLAAAWGPAWTDVLRQVAPKLEGTARVMVNMTPEAARRLDIAVAQDVEGASKSLPKGEAALIDETLATEFEPFAESLADNTDAEARLDEHFAAARSLALSYRLRGVSADEAARTAFAHVVGEQYEFRGKARIPRAFDADAVMDGADAARERVTTEALRIDATAFSDAESAQRDLKYTVRAKGYWATNPDGSGLVLRIPHRSGQGVVKRADGTPISYTWAELNAMSGERRLGPRDTYTERNMATK